LLATLCWNLTARAEGPQYPADAGVEQAIPPLPDAGPPDASPDMDVGPGPTKDFQTDQWWPPGDLLHACACDPQCAAYGMLCNNGVCSSGGSGTPCDDFGMPSHCSCNNDCNQDPALPYCVNNVCVASGPGTSCGDDPALDDMGFTAEADFFCSCDDECWYAPGPYCVYGVCSSTGPGRSCGGRDDFGVDENNPLVNRNGGCNLTDAKSNGLYLVLGLLLLGIVRRRPR